MTMGFWGASRRVFDLSLGEMLWSRRTIFMALVVGGPVILAIIVISVLPPVFEFVRARREARQAATVAE